MDTSLIIGIAMLALFVVPVFIVMQKQGKDKKKLDAELKTIEKENDLIIGEHETWRNKVIGMDTVHAKGVMLVRNEGQNQVFIADLHHYSRCVVEKGIVAAEKDAKVQAVSSVKIRFIHRDKTMPGLVFRLFDDDADLTLGNELRIAEEWSLKFNNLIRNHSKAA